MSLVKDSSAHFVSWNTKLSSETFKLPSERLCRLCQLDDQTAWYVSTVSELLAAANPWFVMLGVWRRHVVMLARNGSSALAGHILWVCRSRPSFLQQTGPFGWSRSFANNCHTTLFCFTSAQQRQMVLGPYNLQIKMFCTVRPSFLQQAGPSGWPRSFARKTHPYGPFHEQAVHFKSLERLSLSTST